MACNISGNSELITKSSSLRAQRGSLPPWNQPVGDRFVTSFLTVTNQAEVPLLFKLQIVAFFQASA
jgi:hypothetical protein